MIVLLLANIAAWALFHSVTGYAVHRVPVSRLQTDGAVFRTRRWEPRLYRCIRVKHWKDRLPEAGALFSGGMSKRTLGNHVTRFAVETRRAEAGHWLAMACGPLACIWNPPLGCVLMIAYGLCANAPFIAVQRYNRARALRVVARTSMSRRLVGATDRTTGSNIP